MRLMFATAFAALAVACSPAAPAAPTVEEIAKASADLTAYLDAEYEEGLAMSPMRLTMLGRKEQQDKLITEVTQSLAIRSTGRDNLYTLSYRGETPDKALRVVQSLMTIFVESSLGDSKTDSDTARRFIEDQIKNYENKLTEAESRLKEFRLRNIGAQGADGRLLADDPSLTTPRGAAARLLLWLLDQDRAIRLISVG